MSEQLSVSQKLQLEKRENFNNEIQRANEAFVQMYDKDAEKIFSREKGFAMMALQKNPKIMDCKPETIFLAVSNVAMSGLSLDPVKQLAHLVPRGEVCTLVVDYKGLIELLTRDAGIRLTCGAVYEGDKGIDDFKEGVGGYVNAKRQMNRPETAKIIYCYSVATFPDGQTHCHILDMNQISKRSKKATTDAVWKDWFEEMCVKTVVRSHYKFLPKSERLDKAMDLIDTENGNRDFNKPTNISDSIEDIPVNVPPKKEERPEGTVTVEKAAVKLNPNDL